MTRLAAIADRVGRWFPVIVVAAGAVALAAPDVFVVLAPAVPWLLALIMLGMGMTLRPVDFSYVARKPGAFAVGLLSQYTIMPASAWLIVTAVELDPAIAVGVVLVACSPGGTASNVMVYLSRGDTALSVAMTSVSTLVAPIVTPLLVLLLAGSYLPVSPGSLFVSIVQVVLVPVLVGLLLRRVASRAVERALPILPVVSVVGIALVVVAVVAGSAEELLVSGLVVLGVVVALNALGLALGYVAARLIGLDEGARRAISIEVGMQNSGLAASLATVHFTPAAALPGAVFSVWHNVSGSALAAFWRRRPTDARRPDDASRSAVRENTKSDTIE